MSNSLVFSPHLRLPAVVCGFLVVGMTFIGCGPSGPVTYTATGQVTFEGQPVQEGEIIFRAADGASGSWEGKIVGGSYSLQTTEGSKRVEITARRKVEGAPAAESGEPALSFESYIPEKYNEKSELTANVTPSGPNEFNFELIP